MSRLHDNDLVVIIGGGVIGLSTAYNLAKGSSLSSQKTKTKIKVIEAFDEPFKAASSRCTGCFHYGFPETKYQPLLPLGKYSFGLWEAEARETRFRIATGYTAQSSFGVSPGTGHGLEELPDWLQRQSSWDVDTNVLGAYTATINPIGLGKWLTSQCLERGVEIQTGLRVVDISLSAGNKVQAVTYRKEDKTTIRIDCEQVLLACGAWTPTVYGILFSSSPISLQWTIDAGDCILCKSPCPAAQFSTAFVSLANGIGEKLEFAARDDGTIWACGRRNHTATIPSPGRWDQPDQRLIEELSGHSRRWLDWRCNCTEKHADSFQLVGQGRAFRPATISGLPIISEVMAQDLTSNLTANASQAEKCSSEVFICWGHGSYGLTLGMGSGRLMSQLMSGEKPDIDLSLFSLGHNSSRVSE